MQEGPPFLSPSFPNLHLNLPLLSLLVDSSDKQTTWYDCWLAADGFHGTFSEQDHEQHSILRRRAAQAYAMTSILTYEPKIQKLLDINWLQFRKFSSLHNIIDMEHWAQYFAYDVVSELALGRAFGMLKEGHDVGDYMKSVVANFYLSSNLGHIPGKRFWLNNRVSQYLFQRFGNDTLKGTYKFRRFMTQAVGDRYFGRTKPEGADMLQHLMEAKDRDGTPVKFLDVQKECSNILGAGTSLSPDLHLLCC